MYRLYFLLLIFTVFWQRSNAGKSIVINNIRFSSIVNLNQEPDANFTTLIVPIKRAGNLIIVEAVIDTIEGNFVLDTGAPGLILNETYFRDLPKISDQDIGGINGSSESFTTVIHNFRLLDLKYQRLITGVTDLSSIENGRNIKILGLLGTGLFSKFAITVDLFRNVLYIQKTDNKGNIPKTERVFHDRFMVSPFTFSNNIIFLNGSVNKKTLLFVFDTGAETNLLDYDHTKKLLNKMEVISRSKVSGVGGTSFNVVSARFDELMVGDRMFMRNRVLLTNLEKVETAYNRSFDGILGYDFFVRGIFTINFVKKEFEMYIYTNQ